MRGELGEANVDPDPLTQFRRWLSEAVAAGVDEPNAMTLATVGENGAPAARIVLLKGIEEGGLSFFTNYESDKGRQLERDPRAALVFYWKELEREIRAEGRVMKLPRGESEVYFRSRPLTSRLGALASDQSRVLASRAELERRYHEWEKKYEGREIPMPAYWGGFRFFPLSIEFWQGRPGRLHDRLRYRREGEEDWRIERLYP